MARSDYFEVCELLPGVGFDAFYRSYAEAHLIWVGAELLLEDVLAIGEPTCA